MLSNRKILESSLSCVRVGQSGKGRESSVHSDEVLFVCEGPITASFINVLGPSLCVPPMCPSPLPGSLGQRRWGRTGARVSLSSLLVNRTVVVYVHRHERDLEEIRSPPTTFHRTLL